MGGGSTPKWDEFYQIKRKNEEDIIVFTVF